METVLQVFLRKALPAVRIGLILIWLSNLAHTDAYFSIYVLIAFLALYILIQKGPQTARSSVQKILVPILSGLFSLAVLLANYPLFTAVGDGTLIGIGTERMINGLNTVFSLFGGYITAESILHWFFTSFPMRCPEVKPAKWERFLPYFFFLSIALVHLLHLYLVEFPGNLSTDSFNQIEEMVTGRYTNTNTFWHTMLFKGILSLGYGIFGNVNGAVAFFCTLQVLVLTLAFTNCLMALYDYGVPKAFWIGTYCIYAFLPYNLALSITIWKDVLFSAGILLALSAAFRILEGLSKQPRKQMVIFVLGSLLMIVSRTNGWIIALIFALSYGLFVRKNKRFLAVSGAMALAGWVLLNPVLTYLQVPVPDQVESLSLPIQQVSRVIAEGGALTPEEEELLSQVVDLEQIPNRYVCWLSDPMKVAFREKNPEYLQAHLGDYANLWWKLGLRYPAQYAKAWIDQTKGYWNAGYPYAMYSEGIMDNPYGVAKASCANPIASLYQLYAGLSRHVILFEPLHSIGLHVWLLLLCFFLNLTRKRQAAILSVPLLTIIAGMWLGTPVYCCFRYVYSLFICLPLITATAIFCPEKK